MSENNQNEGDVKELNKRLKALESQIAKAPKRRGDFLLLSATILIATLIVGGFIYMGEKNAPPGRSGSGTEFDSEKVKNVQPVSDSDHVRGNPDAQVTIIEFADFQCSACAQFQPTLSQVLEEYPDKVRLVYRHFPLDTIHPEASPSALASECAAELGENNAFWEFADAMFENQSRLGIVLYREVAEKLGIDLDDFDACLESEKYTDKISNHTEDGKKSGIGGTPYSIVIAPDGTKTPILGAKPYTEFKSNIEEALK